MRPERGVREEDGRVICFRCRRKACICPAAARQGGGRTLLRAQAGWPLPWAPFVAAVFAALLAALAVLFWG
jgi:hypothetical protein